MGKKPFATSIDEDVQKDFKVECVKNNIPMNTVIELFMKAYTQGRFKIEIEYENNQIEDK